MKSLTKKEVISSLKIIVLAFIFSVGVSSVQGGWSDPPGPPTDCPGNSPGCNAPIHVGSSAQTKVGELTAGGFNVPGGSAYKYGTYNFVWASGTNTAVGLHALLADTSGSLITFGSLNTAVGYSALRSNITGSLNTAVGLSALNANISGDYNTAVGFAALLRNTTGTFNTAVGYGADVATSTIVNATALGSGAIVSASNMVRIGNTSVLKVEATDFCTTPGGKCLSQAPILGTCPSGAALTAILATGVLACAPFSGGAIWESVLSSNTANFNDSCIYRFRVTADAEFSNAYIGDTPLMYATVVAPGSITHTLSFSQSGGAGEFGGGAITYTSVASHIDKGSKGIYRVNDTPAGTVTSMEKKCG